MSEPKFNTWTEINYFVATNKHLHAENERLQRELEAARKVADAAADWADALRACDAGASGSGGYLRAREVLLRATVREYRAANLPLESRIDAAIEKAAPAWREMGDTEC